MIKQTLFFIGTILFLAIGAFGLYTLFLKDKTNETVVVLPSQNEVYKTNKSANTTKQTSQLQVQGANTEPKENSTNGLPSPNEFNIYEKYANEQTALYIDVLVGTGKEAVNGTNVAMLYQGWLTNGQLFDQSRENEQGQIEPFVFQIGEGQVIPGWEQTISGMKEGGKRRLIIPATAGYGSVAQGPIPANSMLIFDVELVAVQTR